MLRFGTNQLNHLPLPRNQTVRDKPLDAALTGLHPGKYPLGYVPAPHPGGPHVPDMETA